MAKILFPGLSNSAFAHPLDLSSFEELSRAPMISQFINTLVKYLTEIPAFVELYSSAIRVTDKNYPRIHQSLLEACQILDMSPPDLFVKNSYHTNAFAVGIENPSIILTSSLIDILTEEELQSVIAHELGHIKAKHIYYRIFIAMTTSLGADFVRKIFPQSAILTQSLTKVFLSHMRKCELTADRASLLVVQDPNVIVSCCMKLAGGCINSKHKLSTDEFLVQGKSLEGLLYDSEYASLLFWLKTISQTHPLPVPRASLAHSFGESQTFFNILDGNYKKYDLKECMNCKNETSITNKTCPHCLAKFGNQFLKDFIYCMVCDNAINRAEYDHAEMRFCPDCGSDMMGGQNLLNKYGWWV